MLLSRHCITRRITYAVGQIFGGGGFGINLINQSNLKQDPEDRGVVVFAASFSSGMSHISESFSSTCVLQGENLF